MALDLDTVKVLLSKIKGNHKAFRQDYKRISNEQITDYQYVTELMLSPESVKRSIKHAVDVHLYYIHNARIKLVASLLPKADRILDLGGANGSIYQMGYPHKFRKITIVDLPPEDRVEMYKNLKMKAEKTPNGIIDTHYGSMTNLKFARDNSVDMVWSGESIEHITVDEAKTMLKEARRVLRPGGYLCLDTPNGLVTSIHVRDAGVEFIHPEHKIEYTPWQLKRMLKKAGFKIVESRGVCEMKNTIKNNAIDYTDFVLGNPLPYDVNSAYIQYYCCVKQEPAKSKILRRTPRHLKRLAKKLMAPSS